MKVKDLIEKLEKLPPEKEIEVYCNHTWESYKIGHIKLAKFKTNKVFIPLIKTQEHE